MIRALHIIGGADTQAQGAVLRTEILRALDESSEVAVSFAGLDTATSSFVNACFVDLMEMIGFDAIKRRIRIVDSTRQINDMIKRRLIREASLAA